MIGAGRRVLRRVLHQAALVASTRNWDLKDFADRLRKDGKPRVHLTFFGEVSFSLLYLVRFRRWMRLKILGRATIEALETPNQSDARNREIKSTKKHETHPKAAQGRRHGRGPQAHRNRQRFLQIPPSPGRATQSE